MKFVPIALIWTLRPTTSSATLRTSMLAAARADEYSGAPGVGRAPAALVNSRIWPPPRSIIAGTTPRSNWYGASTQPTSVSRRSSTVERRNRPTTIRPVNAAAASSLSNRSIARLTRASVAAGSLRSRVPSTTSTAAPTASTSATRSAVGSPSTRSWLGARSRASDGPT